MRKFTKILIIALSVMLIAGAFVFAASAADDNSVSTLDAPWQFTDSSGTVRTTSMLSVAVSSAKSGSTVKLLADQTYKTSTTYVARIDKELTIDLGGHTFVMSQSGQHYIGILTTQPVKICNGTLVAGSNSAYNSNNSGYAAIFNDIENSNLTLENLNTYTACLYLSGWKNGPTLNIIGGEHHVIYDDKDLMEGGLVETRVAAEINVSDASIYLNRTNASVANAMFYNYKTGKTTKTQAVYTYTNCNIYAVDGKTSIIAYAQENFKAKFIGCNIYGSIAPMKSSHDSKYGEVKNGAIELSGGTLLGGGAGYEICDAVVCAEGASIITIDEHVSFKFKTASGSPYFNATTGSLSDVNFSTGNGDEYVARFYNCYGTADDYSYSYVSNGSTHYTNSLATALAYADDVITVNNDVSLDATAEQLPVIRKNLTIDLGENILEIAADGGSPIYIAEGKTLTVRNGNIVKSASSSASAYPVFASYGKNVQIVFDGVNVNAGALVTSEFDGAKVTVNGGTHVIDGSSVKNYAYFDFSADTELTVSGAKIVSLGGAVMSSATLGSSVGGGSKLHFLNSTIASKTNGKILKYANKATDIIFDECDIYGVINATAAPSDKAGAISVGSIILSEGTRISNPASNYGGGIILSESKKVFVPYAVTEVLAYKDAVGAQRSFDLTYEYVIGNPSADAVAIYTDGKLTVATDDFKTAVAYAASYTDVTLLSDVRLVESQKGFAHVRQGMTLDLNGYTLELIQQGEAHIYVDGDFTVKNGNLRAAMDKNAPYPGLSYPMFCYKIDSKNITLTLDNVNTYAGSLVFAWNCSGHALNVIGGKHQVLNTGTGNDNGWLDVRGDFKLNATGASFVMNGNSPIVSALSYKDTDTSVLAASFNFTGCNLISLNGTSSIIGYANENSNFRFDACNIYGTFNPKLHTNDKNAGYSEILPGAIVLGAGTKLISRDVISGAVAVDKGLLLLDTNETISVKYYDYKFDPGKAEFTIEGKRISTLYAVKAVSYEDTLVNVKWYAEDGKTLIKEEAVPAGTTVTPPSYTPKSSNGWFKTEYSGWSTSFAKGGATENFTVTADVSFYPAPSSELVPEFTVSAHSITLIGKIRNNLYIPVASNEIKLIGVYDLKGNVIRPIGVSSGGVDYYKYDVGEVGASNITSKTTVKVKYAVNGQQMEATVTLSPAEYAEKLLIDSKSEAPIYDKSAHILAADLIRYSNYFALVTDGSTNPTLDALISQYGDVASDMPSSNDFSNQTASTSELKDIITSIQLEVSSSEPRWLFNIKSGALIDSITVSVEGYLPKIVGSVNFGKLTYKTERVLDGSAFITENIPMYNLDRLMTITVKLADGTEREGLYSLNSYFNGFAYTSDSAGETVKTFLKAFRAFGVSSSGYKYGDSIVKEGTVADFWQCDHAGLGLYFQGRGRYCADCATHIFFYSDFGAIADGKSDRASNVSGTNSHQAMYECHSAANVWADNGYKTAVMAVGGAHNGNVYYIGAPSSNKYIPIKTDTNWAGAEFIVDDRTVHQDKNDGYKTAVFQAVPDSAYNGKSYTSYITKEIPKGSTHIGFAPGRAMVISIYDQSRRNNIRQGANENSGASIREMLLVDEYGNISPTTPVEWDYYNVTYCKYGCKTIDSNSDKKCDTCANSITTSLRMTGYDAQCAPITISGLDKNGNIDFIWETVTDPTVDVTTYDQCGRTFKVARSNVSVSGIDHIFTEDDTSETPRQAYSGIVSVNNCNNVVVSDVLVWNHLGHDDVNGVGLGSYEFSGGDACNISLIRYKVKNFFGEGGKVSYRGLFGTNYIRNFYLKDCFLTSFDSHSGAYNVTLEDCTFEHINLVGGGDAYLKNVTVYTDGSDAACILRQDYGSMWNGNIYIDGLDLRYSDTTNKCIDLVESSYTNWYFGTDTYLPINIEARNVVIHRYERSDKTAEFKDGKLVENIVSTNEIPLGIHYQINRMMNAHVDYSTSNQHNLDPKHCTEKIVIEDCGNLAILYPDHTYFKNMEVWRDGVKLDWYVKRNGFICTDMNGDYICDECMATIECTGEHPATGEIVVNCTVCGSVRCGTDEEASGALKFAFECVQNGVTIKKYEGTKFSDLLTTSDEGTTITLLADVEETLSAPIAIKRSITVNLNGYTLSIKTPSGKEAFTLNSDKTLTLEGGTLICMSGETAYGDGRPFVNIGARTTFNLINMTTFTGVLVYSYAGSDCNVNITGGEHYAVATPSAGMGGYIESRANMKLTAKNALFVVTNTSNNSSYSFISSVSYKHSANTPKSTDFTFENCDILNLGKGNLFNYTNGYFKVAFNNCRISGKLNNGAVNSNDKSSGESVAGFITLGAGTKLLGGSGTSYVDSKVALADGVSYSSVSTSVTYKIKKISGSLYADNFSYSDYSVSVTYKAQIKG